MINNSFQLHSFFAEGEEQQKEIIRIKNELKAFKK